jgi:hypothetical protein
VTEPTIAQLAAKISSLERLADQLVRESRKAEVWDGNKQVVLLDVAYRIRYILDAT